MHAVCKYYVGKFRQLICNSRELYEAKLHADSHRIDNCSRLHDGDWSNKLVCESNCPSDENNSGRCHLLGMASIM